MSLRRQVGRSMVRRAVVVALIAICVGVHSVGCRSLPGERDPLDPPAENALEQPSASGGTPARDPEPGYILRRSPPLEEPRSTIVEYDFDDEWSPLDLVTVRTPEVTIRIERSLLAQRDRIAERVVEEVGLARQRLRDQTATARRIGPILDESVIDAPEVWVSENLAPRKCTSGHRIAAVVGRVDAQNGSRSNFEPLRFNVPESV